MKLTEKRDERDGPKKRIRLLFLIALAGDYIYRLIEGTFHNAKKLVVLK